MLRQRVHLFRRRLGYAAAVEPHSASEAKPRMLRIVNRAHIHVKTDGADLARSSRAFLTSYTAVHPIQGAPYETQDSQHPTSSRFHP